MKKSLIALAVLGAFAGAASAQSSVTVYGRVNLGVVKNFGVDKAQIDASNGANRLGFRGVEDLGNGLKGTFNLEHRFSPESGGLDGSANGRPFWQGTAKLGLSHAWGTVEIGRMLTAFQAPVNATDPWGTETVGSLAVLAGDYATDLRTSGLAGNPGDGAGLGRTDVITYTSPKFAGFTGSVSFGPERSAGAGATTEPGKDLYSFWLGYAAGPLAVGGGLERNRNDHQVAAILGSFDLGVAKIMGGYSQTDTNNALAAAGTTPNSSDRKAYNLAVTVPVGSFNIKAGWARVEPENTSGIEFDKYAVGAEYLLSKRTYVYTTYGRNDPNRARLDGTFAAGFNPNKKDAFDIGVNHNF